MHIRVWRSAQISLGCVPFCVIPTAEFHCLIACFCLSVDNVAMAQERLINLSFLLVYLLLGSHLHNRTHCDSSTKQSCHNCDGFHISSRNQLCLYSSGESEKKSLNISSFKLIQMAFSDLCVLNDIVCSSILICRPINTYFLFYNLHDQPKQFIVWN